MYIRNFLTLLRRYTRAERCRERGEWSAEGLEWRREGDGRVGGRGQTPWGGRGVTRC